MKNPNKYKAIDCALYDHVELWAMRKNAVKIVYSAVESHKTHTVKEIIVNTMTRDKVEYILLESGLVLRMDQIVQIEEIVF